MINFNVLNLTVKLFVFWILLLAFFFLIGNILLGGNSSGISILANWDGRHFLDIARYGYREDIQYAFFPLYPLLINLFSKFLKIDFLFAGLFINLICVFGIIYLFLNIIKKYGENAVKTTIFFLIFPTSFYLIAVYSESLFLFLTLGTFYLSLRKKYLSAAIFASLASVTRIAGAGVILGLAFEIITSNLEFRKKIAIIFVSLSGFFLYGLYLYSKTGNPFYFFISELSWGRSVNIPGTNIRDSILYIAVNSVKPESFTILSDLIFTVFGIGMVIRVIKSLKPQLAVFSGISLLIPLSTAILLSIPRFLLVIFPIFVEVSKIKNRIFNISYVIISLVLLFLYFNFFLRSIWVS